MLRDQGQRSAGLVARRQKGFSLIELLIVVAIILIIAAIAIPNLLRSRIAANEASAVQSMRTITTVQNTYNSSYGAGYSPSLAALGPPAAGAAPTAAAADLIDSNFAAGTKSGYTFTYTPSAAIAGIIYNYTLNADPVTVGTTGQRHFFTDQTGVIRANTAAKAAATDPAI
ncbi:MAG: prepilin-type N-terminal cleavage/methylation domain-containing protein [Acidobacteria bacterium]|nr:prepilin-type N-terminal cleavage/methylation domain-containing protein [Acidobacteriota bacterium]MBI3662744.1 prepilin-type N-terminal cleavage/methylation domain-containing protein [Acidobacteriota bacterium]